MGEKVDAAERSAIEARGCLVLSGDRELVQRRIGEYASGVDMDGVAIRLRSGAAWRDPPPLRVIVDPSGGDASDGSVVA